MYYLYKHKRDKMEEGKEVERQPETQLSEAQVEELLASDKQPSKSGRKKTVLVVCIVSIVVLLGLGALALVLTQNNSSKTSNTKKDDSSSKTKKKDEPKKNDDDDDTGEVDIKKDIKPVSLDSGVDDDRIQELFKATESKINELEIELGELKVFKEYPVPYSYKAGYATWLDKGYGLQTRFPSSDGSVNYGSIDDMRKIHNEAFDEVLLGAGFVMTDNLDNVEELGGEYHAFLDSNGYFCEYQDQEIYLACGNINWLSKEQQDLITGLTDAIYVGHEGERAKDGVLLIIANSEDIEDSDVKPYQRLHAYSLTGGLWFYRNSPNSKWVYVYGGNAPTTCELLNPSEDMKNAYKGSELPCYNEKN